MAHSTNLFSEPIAMIQIIAELLRTHLDLEEMERAMRLRISNVLFNPNWWFFYTKIKLINL